MTAISSNLLIGTGNPGKIKEISLALKGLPLTLRSLDQFPNLIAPIESGETYAENAVIKATDYARQTGLCVLADDSGLETDILNGAPGLHSARFSTGSDADRVELLLSKLAGTSDSQRRARFVSVIAIVHPEIGVISIAEGACRGRINHAAVGHNGFGYDPVFVPDGFDLTFAQLPSEVKARISHRAKSLQIARAVLEDLLSAA
ncbi:MAG TPA: non-canonical purine NTP pyrophosphatase [Pyrinomonadaceae bacterium]|nr:non-canonical purine NTP pyrophosphatase [Pyrinomonadaceae bacterium]